MIFDLVVLAVILISCLIAFLRGFIREVLTVLGVVGGIAAAVAAGPKLTPYVQGWLGHDKARMAKDAAQEAGRHAKDHADKLFGLLPYNIAAEIIAYGGVFIVVVIILSIISHFLSGFAKKIGLGAVDRTLGIFFGVVRAVILLGLLYLPVYLLADQTQLHQWFGDSRTRVCVQATSAWLDGFLPKTARRSLNEAADKASASMVGATRDRLMKIDALKDDHAESHKVKDGGMPSAVHPAASSAVPPAAQPGYSAPERGALDTLIQDENKGGAGKTAP
jgi:membrane protein required for colicin V production